MKYCPKCRSFYDDADLAFCLSDGIPLTEINQSNSLWNEGKDAVEYTQKIVSKQAQRQKFLKIAKISVTMILVAMSIYVVVMNISVNFPTKKDETAKNISPSPTKEIPIITEVTPSPKPTIATPTPKKKTSIITDDENNDDEKKDDEKKDDEKKNDEKKDDDKKDDDKKDIKTISGGVVNSRATNLVQPTYPSTAKAVRASGQVKVQVTIDENGNVIAATAINGHPSLKSSAEQAARASKFSPTLLSGQKVKVTGTIVYVFQP